MRSYIYFRSAKGGKKLVGTREEKLGGGRGQREDVVFMLTSEVVQMSC